MPGMGELLIILLIVLLIFGAGKLPAIGDALGRSIKNFKRGANGDGEIEVSKTREVAQARRSELKGVGVDVHDEADDEAELVAQKRRAAARAGEGAADK
ncbi:MAG TPA: twin-arginine translocase TatA/TatE family subunit [Kofleriaceae bacterium]|nr:twin-arginine translocase TatA/TatE family subunit [Kofleriaceae bacterium]